MSHAATAWAWDVPDLSPAHRLVLLALAERVNSDGECWPAVRLLAERCGMSDGHVRRVVAELVTAGLAVKLRRHRRPDGTLGTWTYRLAVDNQDHQRAPTRGGPARVGARTSAQNRPEPARTHARAESVIEPVIESRRDQPAPAERRPAAAVDNGDRWKRLDSAPPSEAERARVRQFHADLRALRTARDAGGLDGG